MIARRSNASSILPRDLLPALPPPRKARARRASGRSQLRNFARSGKLFGALTPFLIIGLALAPCGEVPVARAAPPNPAAKPSPGGKPGAAAPTGAAAAAAEALQQRLIILRRKVLRDEDFNETDDANRDPFRSFAGIFSDRGARVNVQQVVPSIFGKFALEELTLIAVITGDANPRAMFRDPSGLGQVIKRGDYLSKSAARVTKILSDRVVLELAEVASGGETRALEKAILVNPEGAEK